LEINVYKRLIKKRHQNLRTIPLLYYIRTLGQWTRSLSNCDAYSPNSTWLVTSQNTLHNKFDVSSASWRACRAGLFEKLDTAKMHGRVVSRCDVTSHLTVHRYTKSTPN